MFLGPQILPRCVRYQFFVAVNWCPHTCIGGYGVSVYMCVSRYLYATCGAHMAAGDMWHNNIGRSMSSLAIQSHSGRYTTPHCLRRKGQCSHTTEHHPTSQPTRAAGRPTNLPGPRALVSEDFERNFVRVLNRIYQTIERNETRLEEQERRDATRQEWQQVSTNPDS